MYLPPGVAAFILAVDDAFTVRESLRPEWARVMESANAAVFAVDDRMRLNEWNSKAAKISGFTSTEVLGCEFTMLVPVEARDAVKKVLADALEGLCTSNFELPVLCKRPPPPSLALRRALPVLCKRPPQ